MGLSDFFSSGGKDESSSSFSGLRGIAGGQYANDMAKFLTPTVQRGALAGENMFVNPSQYLDSNGLYAQQSAMFPTIVNQIMNKMSAGGAARGQLNPLNTSAIAGSSATAAAPFLMPLIGQNINELRNAGGNMFASMLNTGAGALGQESHSTGTSRGPGLGYGMVNNLFQGLGQGIGQAGAAAGIGAMCWVAQELYGHNDGRVSLIRDYINANLSSDTLIGQFARWYVSAGSEMANALSNGEVARAPWLGWFGYLAHEANESRHVIISMAGAAGRTVVAVGN